MPTSLMYPAYVVRFWKRIPLAVSCKPVSGFSPTSPGVGSLRGGTVSQSWHATDSRAATNAPKQVLAIASLLEVERAEARGARFFMAQNSTSTLKKKLRFAG